MMLSKFKSVFLGTGHCMRNFSSTTRAFSGLKIAFFGSDEFSISSLKQLLRYQKEYPSRIETIDVITRSIKPTGRNLKNHIDLPIGQFSEQHGINVIRADSGRQIMDSLKRIEFNAAIAVSYGRLIPADFIFSCKYGGFNVHPSLLPRYAGPSPLQYTLMNNDKICGVTLQTLHPTKFDGGDILAQSEEIPVDWNDTYASLEKKLGDVGGKMLVDFIHNEAYITKQSIESPYLPSHAPMLDPTARLVDWGEHTSINVKRLSDALGHIYTFKFVDITKKKKHIQENHKVLLYGIDLLEMHDNTLKEPGEFMLDSERNLLIVKTKDGFVSARSLKMQYCPEENPTQFVKKLEKRTGHMVLKFL